MASEKNIRDALRNAMALHIEHDCVRYIIASVGARANGALKATHHMRICQYLVASLTGKVDPDKVYMWHPLYEAVHDGSQEFTGALADDADSRWLALRFADHAIECYEGLTPNELSDKEER